MPNHLSIPQAANLLKQSGKLFTEVFNLRLKNFQKMIYPDSGNRWKRDVF